MIWRILEGDTVVEERRQDSSWTYTTAEMLIDEIHATGLQATPGDGDLIVIAQASGS